MYGYENQYERNFKLLPVSKWNITYTGEKGLELLELLDRIDIIDIKVKLERGTRLAVTDSTNTTLWWPLLCRKNCVKKCQKAPNENFNLDPLK
jgi:hypothetical protein